MKQLATICLLALGVMLTGCGEYYRQPPPLTPPGGARPTSARIAYDISRMKMDFTKLDVAVLHKTNRLCTGKVEGEQLVVAFDRDSSIRLKELTLEITRDGKTLLKKDLESANNADVRSLDQKGP